MRLISRLVVPVVTLAVATVLGSSAAFAATGSIDHAESHGDKLQILYSVPDKNGTVTPDLSSLLVTVNGQSVPAVAQDANQAKNGVRRTAILAIDVSKSMAAHNKFAQAKAAAKVFLQNAPANLYVGIVTFASQVTVAQQPSLDRAQSAKVLDSLKLSLQTLLYDGVKQAVSTAGTKGQRSIVLLTDGADTTTTSLSSVTSAIKKSGDNVDVVSLATGAKATAALQAIAQAGKGKVLPSDPTQLVGAFSAEASALSHQILVTVTVPAQLRGKEGTVKVSIDANGQSYTSSAYLTVGQKPPPKPVVNTDLTAPPAPFLSITHNEMLAGLAALVVGILAIAAIALLGGKKEDSLAARIAPYAGGRRSGNTPSAPKAPPVGITAQAIDVAGRALKANAGFDEKIRLRLDGAGMDIKPAEWVLIHTGIAIGAGIVGFALSGGSIVVMLLALVAGVVLPWLYLGFKRSRRLKAFNGQLAPTLQLMAGSLQAGLSLPQAVDTVVREGLEPIASEFRRALVETRLGVSIEDALEPIGKRMSSTDFDWAVMAIGIQREVGGNLSELLLQVAATLRERDYLRRQVKALSAEGRFSSYILLILPPALIAYMLIANRGYLHPLVSTPIGYLMIVTMVVLMSLGSFMMNRMIKLDV